MLPTDHERLGRVSPLCDGSNDEDGIDQIKAAERAATENWVRDPGGGYVDRDGSHRDRYGDRD